LSKEIRIQTLANKMNQISKQQVECY